MLGKFPPNYPFPVRPPAIIEYLKNAKKKVMTQENANFDDRGVGTLADELSANEIFTEYASMLKPRMSSEPSPMSLQLSAALPVVSNMLEQLNSRSAAQVKVLEDINQMANGISGSVTNAFADLT